MRHVVVFDTNVLFSGIGWKGRPAQCLDLARSGTIEALTCEEIVDELAEKLAAKLSFSPEEISETVADLLSFLQVVKISNQLKVLVADPDDDKVLECATLGGATHIVTGDKRHLLPLGSFQGIPIVTPANFLQVVSSAP